MAHFWELWSFGLGNVTVRRFGDVLLRAWLPPNLPVERTFVYLLLNDHVAACYVERDD